MSAPRVVNTKDGLVWTRREGTRGGEALYAPEKCGSCPQFVMATLTELAEIGIAGSADCLPVPAGSVPLRDAEDELTGARLSLFEEEQETARLRLALASAQRGRRELRELIRQMCGALNGYDCPPPGETPFQLVTRVSIAWSEAERQVAELEALVSAATEFRVWEPGYGLYVRRAPGTSGFAVLEARRSDRGRRAWTTAGWQYQALLTDAELFCWPDPVVAVAEARRVMPGALPDGITRWNAPTQALQVDADEAEAAQRSVERAFPKVAEVLASQEGEFHATLHHPYTTPHDMPETGGA